MTDIEKDGTLDEKPPVFKSWNAWYIAVVIGNVLFCIWMIVYFSKFN